MWGILISYTYNFYIVLFTGNCNMVYKYFSSVVCSTSSFYLIIKTNILWALSFRRYKLKIVLSYGWFVYHCSFAQIKIQIIYIFICLQDKVSSFLNRLSEGKFSVESLLAWLTYIANNFFETSNISN